VGAVPERSCAICRTKLPQQDLQRWVVSEGVATKDIDGKQAGRGYYSCAACAGKAQTAITARSEHKKNKRSA